MQIDMVIKIIGILFVLVGIIYLLKPIIVKHVVGFLEKGKRIYIAGLIRFVLAIVFLLGARECDITWVIVAFGIIFLIAGILIFMMGPEKLKPILGWYLKQSFWVTRVLAVIIIAVGSVIIYSA